LEQPRKRRQSFSPGHSLEEERVGQSATTRLVTSKTYQYKQVDDRLDQQERDRKRTYTALIGEYTTLETSSPPTEDKVKNKHVQEVEEWSAATVKETIFHYIKSNALRKIAEKHINEEM
jgi:major membrane immunogen (membrane-anchored lipoprotein)